MGLCAHAKGLTDKTEFNCGYVTFGRFRMELAKVYNQELGEIYERWYVRKPISLTEEKRLDNEFPDGLANFLYAPDCSAKFTPKECREIFNDIKDLQMDMIGHNYGVMEDYNMLEHWKNIFKHCYKRRVNLYFS